MIEIAIATNAAQAPRKQPAEPRGNPENPFAGMVTGRDARTAKPTETEKGDGGNGGTDVPTTDSEIAETSLVSDTDETVVADGGENENRLAKLARLLGAGLTVQERDARTSPAAETPAAIASGPEEEDLPQEDAETRDEGATAPIAVPATPLLPQANRREPSEASAKTMPKAVRNPEIETINPLDGGEDGDMPESRGDTRQNFQGERAAVAAPRNQISTDTLAMRVAVVDETANPVPLPPQNPRTVTNLAAAIASDRGWSTAIDDLNALRTDAPRDAQAPIRDLRIQLKPAELGEVNARLRISGEQLSVEIRVESHEAFRRLSADKDAIVTSLRGLGFRVDDVSIVQQQANAGQAAGANGGRANDPSSGQPQGSGQQHDGRDGANGGGRNDGETARRNLEARNAGDDTRSGGIYI